jgi:hypothetical protein
MREIGFMKCFVSWSLKSIMKKSALLLLTICCKRRANAIVIQVN